ncbi:MAG: sulfotransferase domain-containing protein [Ktedonobacteraceae bacterium]
MFTLNERRSSSFLHVALRELNTTCLKSDMKFHPPKSVARLYRGISSPLRILPDFLIIGTQRGGTTSLYNYLVERPGVGPAFVKELHFFDKKFHKGPLWYRAHFPLSIQKHLFQSTQKQAYVTGEASAYYIFHPHAPKRVAKILPNVKLIILLRNPIDRAYSQYNFEVELGRETLSFEDALNYEEKRITKEREKILADERYVSFDHSRYSYLARGIYVDQLQTWMSFFPREQFLILKSEDFYTDPATVLGQVLEFLNLPTLELQERKKEYKQYNYNNTPYPKMDAGTRKHLIEYFAPHNLRLYDFLGINFGWE